MLNYKATMDDKLLTVTEACNLLQISPSTLRRADTNGTIRVVRTPGGRRRIPMSEITRYLSHGQEAQADSVTASRYEHEYPVNVPSVG